MKVQLIVMATANSQVQPIKEQNAEQKVLDEGQETINGSDVDTSHDLQTALDRIRLLESGHKELMSLFHKCLVSFTDKDQKIPEPKGEHTQSEPECEIVRISNAEWRARQDLARTQHPRNREKFSLLTLASKERGDLGLRSQAVEVQPGPLPGSGESTADEVSAVPTLGNKNTSEKPYRAISTGMPS